MNRPVALTINIDGAARGNPGPAAWAYVVSCDGVQIAEDAQAMGEATNNVAEYTALVQALKAAAEKWKTDTVLIQSDSELLVKQMNGEYKVKNENLKPLFREARQLESGFRSVDYKHVYREDNKEADRLCNEALDGLKKGAPPSPRPFPHKGGRGEAASATSSPPSPLVGEGGRRAEGSFAAVLAEAERLVNDAARAWIKTGRKSPSPAEVVQQIVDLLRSRGYLKPG